MTTGKEKAGFATEGTYSPDQLIGSNSELLESRKYTLVSGQNVLRGTVLGVITTGGKLSKSLSAASDGSQTPFGIAVDDVDASAGDKEILVYVRGNFNEHALIVGTAHTLASIREGLRSKGIILQTPIQAV